MLVVKVMQTGQASFSAASVALMGRHSGRSGPLDARTPPTLSSSHSSSPWDKAISSGPAPDLCPGPYPPVPHLHTLRGSPSTLIPHPGTPGPTLRPRPTAVSRKPAGCPHLLERGCLHPVPASQSYLEHLHPGCLPTVFTWSYTCRLWGRQGQGVVAWRGNLDTNLLAGERRIRSGMCRSDEGSAPSPPSLSGLAPRSRGHPR